MINFRQKLFIGICIFFPLIFIGGYLTTNLFELFINILIMLFGLGWGVVWGWFSREKRKS